MIRINLLPHREERRKQQQQQFIIMLLFVAVLGAASWFSVHTYLNDRLQEQQSRNKYLEDEIVKLDRQIAEIKKLQEQTAALLARKKVVETLQSNRAEVVHLLDQLVRQMPEGIYLRSLTQRGLAVNILGYAQSNARVSTLMRNIESSPWLASPQLVEIKASKAGTKRLSEFNMNLQLKRVQLKDAPKADAKAPAKKG